MASVTLGGSKCILEYLNEGGANFVFRIVAEPDGELPPRLRRKLLRLRKQVVGSPEALLIGNQEWKAILPAGNLIQYEAIDLGPDVATAVNDLLDAVKGRATHRKQDVWLGDTHGLLVTDMSPGPGGRLVELKPKWLSQSPSAPPHAKRCRTCALRAQRAAENKVITATDAQGSCPLDLVSDVSLNRTLAAERLTNHESVRSYLIEDARPLLQTLQQYQSVWDPAGCLSQQPDVRDLGKAMTLRDCTLYVLAKGSGEIEARVGDLDLKGVDKLARWQAIERGLVDGGWYMHEDNICFLSRG